MLILTIKTDQPEAEVSLCKDGKELQHVKWQAHKQLSETIHKQIKKILEAENKDWSDLEGIVCFKGPGSFTGLRIGLTVGDTLAMSLKIPVVSTTGKGWIKKGILRIQNGEDEKVALPEYGAPVHITKPRK